MPNFFVHFIAHIDMRKKPDGFPHEVYVDETYEAQDQKHLGQIVNKRFVDLVTSAGIVVMKNYTEMVDLSTLSFDKRVFVPWHMITHFEVTVNQLVEPQVPTPLDALIPEPTPEPAPKVPVTVN